MTDYYVNIITGKRQQFSSEDIIIKQKRLFYSILDVIYSEINLHFHEKDSAYKTFKEFLCTSTTFLNDEIICRYAKTFSSYQSNKIIIILKYQYQLGKTLFTSGSDLFE